MRPNTKWEEKLTRFLEGRYIRYGTDALSRFLMIAALVLFVITSFRKLQFLNILPLAMLVYCYFRLLSRNVTARYAENEKFVKLLNGVSARTEKLRKKIRNQKEQILGVREGDKVYRIYRCPVCNQKIRIPSGKGKIMVSCPKCGKEFLKRS